MDFVQLTESKSFQAMCQVYAAVSYICLGDAESSVQVNTILGHYSQLLVFFIFPDFLTYASCIQALDLIGPVYRTMDSYVGVREKTTVLFAYGFLLMKQQNLQEAR